MIYYQWKTIEPKTGERDGGDEEGDGEDGDGEREGGNEEEIGNEEDYVSQDSSGVLQLILVLKVKQQFNLKNLTDLIKVPHRMRITMHDIYIYKFNPCGILSP